MQQTPNRSPTKLRFEASDLHDKALKKPARKVMKARARLEKADSKVPTKKALTVERATDARSGRKVARLHFTDVQKKPSKMRFHDPASAPARLLGQQAERHNEDQNTAVEASRKTVSTVSGASQRVGTKVQQAQADRPFKALAKAEKGLDKANIRYFQTKEKERAKDARLTSNPVSRWRQKHEIKRRYLTERASGVSGLGTRTASRTAGKVSEKVKQTFVRSKKGIAVGGLIFLLVAMVMNGLSSCSPLVQSGFQAIVVSTYPAEEADMKAAERMYTQMEKDMQSMLNSYERDHDYDEYHYDLDELWHDPHALMAIISAWYGGEAWTADQVYGTLEMLFAKQYKLTEEVKRETRYRTELRTRTYTYTDPETGETEQRTSTYEVSVPYYYYTCYVTLINENLSHLPIYIMSQERVGMYAMYMSTLGNYPDLFRGNRYASKLEDYEDYDVPPEALEDPAFAALIAEAEKYLGYPYVWGGDNPSTSFDCSGFVSWVYMQSGVLNTGRLGATSLYGICTPITFEEARPGDMVFFQGTLPRNSGITHVGIYVGDGMMIHCGSPITYADLRDRYWVEHMFGFGHPKGL